MKIKAVLYLLDTRKQREVDDLVHGTFLKVDTVFYNNDNNNKNNNKIKKVCHLDGSRNKSKDKTKYGNFCQYFYL